VREQALRANIIVCWPCFSRYSVGVRFRPLEAVDVASEVAQA